MPSTTPAMIRQRVLLGKSLLRGKAFFSEEKNQKTFTPQVRPAV
jgi:hypothetical protein